MQLSIKLDLQKISKISFKNRLLVNNHDCHIYCQNIQNLLLIVFFIFSFTSINGWNHHVCIWLSHYSYPLIYSTSKYLYKSI